MSEEAELAEATQELVQLTEQLSQAFAETTSLRKNLIAVATQRREAASGLVSELQALELKLLSSSAQRLPEWVASVDPRRSRIYYINTVNQDTSWERPEAFDGTFVVIDDDTGLTAHARIEAAVKS